MPESRTPAADAGSGGDADARSRFDVHRGVGRSTATNVIVQFATLATGFVVTPFILRRLGQEAFGLWALMGSLITYGVLFDLGISGAVVKYVAHHRARGEAGRARAVVATALRLYLGLGLLAACASAALAPFVPDIFNVDDAHRRVAVAATVVTGIGVAVAIPLSTPRAVLIGLQRFDLANGLTLAATVLANAGIVVVLVAGGGLLPLLAVGIVVTVVLQPVSVAVVRRVAPDIGYGWSGADRQLVRAILSFSSALSINQIASRLASRTDTIVIGIAQSAASVTPYALALRVGQLVLLLTSQFTKVLMPLAADINARDDRARLRNVLVASTRIALAIGAGVGVTAIVLGGAILAAWVGDRYSRYSTIVTIIAAGGIVSAASLAAANILLAIGRQRVLATLSLANGLANLLLSIVLVLSYGIVGAAIGTLAAESAFALVLLPYTARVVGVTIPELMRDAVARVLVPAAALFAVLELVTRVVDASSPVPLVAVAGAGLVFYALVYVVAAASETERAFYVRITSRTLRRLKVR